MLSNKLPFKHYFFAFFNGISVVLLAIWLFKSCSDLNTTFTSIFMDFSALITCLYSIIRVNQSRKGDFKVLDMVTIYYATLFFLFSWFLKMLYIIWDRIWVAHSQDDFKLITSVVVFVTLLINFYVTERVNMENLDKIEADM